jgi:membrane-associated phospholipid phosphatase
LIGMARSSVVSGLRLHHEGSSGLAALRHEAAWALRRLWLPAMVLATVLVGLGLLLTQVLDTGWLAREDQQLGRELAASREPDEVALTSIFTLLAETPTIIALTAVAAVVFRLVFHRWRESVLVVCAVVGETLIFWVTTMLIDRQRPRLPQLDDAPPTSSFPSGHTAASVAFYGTVALVVLWHTRHIWLRVLAVAVAVAVPLLVGGSRLYRGMHYPTDVLAGLLLGVAWLSTVAICLRPERLLDRVRAR